MCSIVVTGSKAILEAVSAIGVTNQTTYLESAADLTDGSGFSDITLDCAVLHTDSGDSMHALSSVSEKWPHCFICMFSPSSWTAVGRQKAVDSGAHMVTSSIQAIVEMVKQLQTQVSAKCSNDASSISRCPLCAAGVPGSVLVEHCGLFHGHMDPRRGICPLCRTCQSNIQRHLKYVHSPMTKPPPSKLKLGVGIVCQRESDGKFLMVQEFCNQGYYMPAGIVELGECPLEATRREAVEEAGMAVILKAILRIRTYYVEDTHVVILTYYGRPADEHSIPKSVPDFESVGAVWATRDELTKVRLRNPDVLTVIDLAESGVRWPLSTFTAES